MAKAVESSNNVTITEDWFDQYDTVQTFATFDMDACFNAFDKDGDGYLNLSEFTIVCRALFRNDKGKIYCMEPKKVQDVFEVFDKNNDNLIDREEFTFCWNNWIKKIVRPVSVFLVVDVQNDFISGTLNISHCAARQNGAEVVEPINRLLETVEFDTVFYSLDWHPSDHVSFIDNLSKRKLHSSSPVSAEDAKTYDTVIFEGPPLMKQRLWPRHCVQDSWGAELHKDLKLAFLIVVQWIGCASEDDQHLMLWPPGSLDLTPYDFISRPKGAYHHNGGHIDRSVKVYKGTNPEVDSYSVFWDNKKLTETTLVSQLQDRSATDIYICGLAYDVCVGATAADAMAIGYRTILIDDCSRGVDLPDIEKTKKNVTNNNGVIVDSSQVKAMVEGRDRRPELGYKLAMELKNALKNPCPCSDRRPPENDIV